MRWKGNIVFCFGVTGFSFNVNEQMEQNKTTLLICTVKMENYKN